MSELKRIVAATLLLAASASQGGNLLFNSSFELGEKGYGIQTCTPSVSDYTGSLGAIDTSVAKFGSNSLRLERKGKPMPLAMQVDYNKTYQGYLSQDRSIFDCKQPYAEVFSHEFPVKEDATYTVSAWVKGCIGCMRVTSDQITGVKKPDGSFINNPTGWKDGKVLGDVPQFSDHLVEKWFPASQDWQRVSFQFTAKKGHTAYALCIALDYPGMEGTLWIDGLQVEEGDLTDYTPATPVEAAVYANEKVLLDPTKADGKLVAISYGKRLASFPLTLTLKDFYYRKNLDSQEFKLELPAGKAVSKDFSFKVNRYGALSISSSLQPETTTWECRDSKTLRPEGPVQTKRTLDDNSYQSEAIFLSLHRPAGRIEPSADRTNRPERLEGFRMGGNGSPETRRYLGLIYSDCYGSLEEILSNDRLCGSILRLWDGPIFNWAENEPQEGLFNWGSADLVVDTANRHGLNVMAVLGNVNFCRTAGKPNGNDTTIPEWAAKRDRLGHPEGTEFPEQKVGFVSKTPRNILPQIDDWRNYIKAIATHFKGRIPYYEIVNEPCFNFTAKYYVEYLKAAYEEIKKADPDAIVIGICTTTDKGASFNGWTRKCLAEGAGAYCDAISLHPYDMDDSNPSGMASIRNVYKALAENGLKTPLWNGETYYLMARPADDVDPGNSWRADAIARRYVLDMGEGLQASVSVDRHTLYSPMECPDNFQRWSMKLLSVKSPNEKLAAMNATAHFLEGAIPLKTINLPDGIISYVFKNGSHIFSAQWSLKESFKATFKAPSGATMTSYDIFGNAMYKDLPEITCVLDRSPVYIEWSGMNGDAAAEAVKNASIRGERDIKMSRAIAFKRDGDCFASITFENNAGSSIANVKAEISSPSFERSPTVSNTGKCEILEKRSVEIPFKLKAQATEIPIKILLSGAGEATVKELSLSLVKELAVERQPSAVQPIEKTVSGKVDSPNDLSASFRVWHDDANLLVEVSVKDDKVGKPTENPWDEDCVELFIDALPFDANPLGEERYT